MDDVSLISDRPVVADSKDLLLWDSWEGEWRDVYILNEENEVITVYNLIEYSLSVQENYDNLKQEIISAAEAD